MIFVGDPGQLLSVGGPPLYAHHDIPFCLQEEIAYAYFKKDVILDQVVQQQEDLSDPLQARFLCLLKDLHDGVVSKSQCEILIILSLANIGVKFEEDFMAMRLFAENAEVNRYNVEKMNKIGNPITRLWL